MIGDYLPENQILSALTDADRDWVLSRSTREDAPVRRTYVLPGKSPSHAYFIERGLSSMVVNMSDSSSVEVGTVGVEGLVGLDAYLGGKVGHVEIFQQVEGEVIVLPVRDFTDLLARSAELQKAMAGFTLSLLRQMTMAIACNRLHPVEQRLARWLLMVRDRVGCESFELTQLFLAQMLGARRPGVSLAANMLKRAKLITYSRGKIQILDSAGLEAAACECYGNLRRGEDFA